MQPRRRRTTKRRRQTSEPLLSYTTIVTLTAVFVGISLWLGLAGSVVPPPRIENKPRTIYGPQHNKLDDNVIRQLDAILVLGGGRPLNATAPPLYVQRRCDDAAAVRQRHATLWQQSNARRRRPYKPLPILCLSAGTAHLPQFLSADGLPVWESTACAGYLRDQYGYDANLDISSSSSLPTVLVETVSYDTIGNAFYARVTHTDWAGWRRLLVVTNDFHMDRSAAIFDWIFGLPTGENSHNARNNNNSPYQLWYWASPDVGLEEAARQARAAKEAASLTQVQAYAQQYTSMSAVYHFLTTQHSLYTATALVERSTREVSSSSVSALVQQSYGGQGRKLLLHKDTKKTPARGLGRFLQRIFRVS